jgi:hypothetical protein
MTGAAIAIDCAQCALQWTEACEDCLVTFVLGREPEDAVVIDADEERALRTLARAGLVPGIRHTAVCTAGGAVS